MGTIFLVGGAVRDHFLGVTPHDKDYVIVGLEEKELLAQGYAKVGLAFPIYLHPETKDEYTLSPCLEDDLRRRDLTINSMALDSDGSLIDPFSGLRDLREGVLRQVSEASFLEDPLRVYRVARFQTAYPTFTIAPETMTLMRRAVLEESFRNLSTERVFSELKTALSLPRPSIFFDTLKQIGCLETHFKELSKLQDVPQRPEYHPEGDAWIHTMLVLDKAASMGLPIEARYAALVHDLGKGVTPKELLPRHHAHEVSGIKEVERLSARLKVPRDWREAALVVTKYHLKVHRIFEMRASTIVRMFYEMDAFRKPQLVPILARCCEADEMGKLRGESSEGRWLERCFLAASNVNASALNLTGEGPSIGEMIRSARVQAVKALGKESRA